jgi:hypothetical protein
MMRSAQRYMEAGAVVRMETNAPIAALHVASMRTSSATVVASVTASAVMAHCRALALRRYSSATSSRDPATTPRMARITRVEVVTSPLTENQNAGVSRHVEIQIRRWIDQG